MSDDSAHRRTFDINNPTLVRWDKSEYWQANQRVILAYYNELWECIMKWINDFGNCTFDSTLIMPFFNSIVSRKKTKPGEVLSSATDTNSSIPVSASSGDAINKESPIGSTGQPNDQRYG